MPTPTHAPITLATLATATPQQVFEQIARHLLSQREPSKNEDGMCLYRGPHGLRCAAGALIADAEYRPEMEELGWPSLISDRLVPDAHSHLVTSMQKLHDEHEPFDWPALLAEFAASFDYVMPVIERECA